MDIFLALLAFTLLIIGLIGSVVPVIPGPPIGYLGIWVLKWSGYGEFSPEFLWTWAAITVVVTVLDYFLPIWMTRKFGGSKKATWGATIGLIVGLFLGPIGIILGPFLGALVGELIHDSEDSAKAFKVAFGSFIAFLCGTGAKLVASGMMIYYAIRALF
ncbi:DUF456 domain-containing protein [Alistipes sp. OttesenSCG-928-B03]|nr:DUF456 domain-containing protein [Alistipes sp. OttesenSCG-928-B03]